MVNFARANQFNYKRNASGLVGDQNFMQLLWNPLNSWGSILEVCQIFTGSWGRNFVDRLVGEKWGCGCKER